jgi:hypothetical protein
MIIPKWQPTLGRTADVARTALPANAEVDASADAIFQKSKI